MFENSMSKMTVSAELRRIGERVELTLARSQQAKKFVSELSPAYMTARKVLRELRAMFDDLAEPALPQRPNWAAGDREVLEKWRKYLAYEETNPLDIEEAPVLQARIGFAYKRAVASLRFFSEVW